MSVRVTTSILLLLTSMLALMPAPSSGQETEPADLHWAYAAYFGTGWYSVADDRDVFIVRMTPRWAWGEATFDDENNRRTEIHLKLPVSVGVDRFDLGDPLDTVDIENLAFLSVNPGIDIEIPVNHTWSLRPYASVGYGHLLGESTSAWSYWGGVKSRLSFQSGKLDWSVLNQIGFVGYTPSDGPSELIWPVMAGLEFRYPMGESPETGNLRLHWHVSYSAFKNDLTFSSSTSANQLIDDQWELGAAISKHDSRIKIWFLKFDRLGLAYRFSSNGELQGVTLVVRSLFDE